MKEIPLTRGYVAIVDDEDFEHLSQFKWYASGKPGNVYAVRKPPMVNGKRGGNIGMHREIMQAIGVDHKNGNTMDNRRENLRLATEQQNAANRRKTRSKTSSQYIGVTWHVREKIWYAACCNKFLGRFTSEHDAAVAFDVAARIEYGEFAKLNFPTPSTAQEESRTAK